MPVQSDPREWNFDPWAAGYDDAVAADEGVHGKYDDVLDEVVERARVRPGNYVLDIGCGTGNLSLRCARAGGVVTAVDPSENMLRIARSKTGSGLSIDYRRVDDPFLELPYPDGHFDAVVSTYAFHHVPPVSKRLAIGEMLRVLAPGGRWVLGDLVFINRRAEQEALYRYEWLEEEYFAHLDVLRPVFRTHGLELHSHQITNVTWVLWVRRGQTR